MRSMAYSFAAYAAFLCGEDTAIKTAISDICNGPIRCTIVVIVQATFLQFLYQFELIFSQPLVYKLHTLNVVYEYL